jgi:hypothetical protein
MIIDKLKAEEKDTIPVHQTSSRHDSVKPEHSGPFLNYQSTITAQFFYSLRGGISETSHRTLLQSIVYQIWKQDARLFPLIRHRYRELKSSREGLPEAKPIWQYEHLKSALESLHNIDFPIKITILIDGMDESDNEMRDDVLKFLLSLASKRSLCTIKIMISSRPDNDIKMHLLAAHHIVLQKQNEEDIRILIDRAFEKLRRLRGPSTNPTRRGIRTAAETSPKRRFSPEKDDNRDIFESIKMYIVTNSWGVILWVTLVLSDLERCIARGGYSLADLEERVRRLPKELGGPEGFYRAMVNSLIDRFTREGGQRQEEDRGRTILAWVVFPSRPISVIELGDALAVPPQPVDPLGYELDQFRPLDLERGILSSCGGLVEVGITAHFFARRDLITS